MVSVLGPTLFNGNYEDWTKYAVGQLLGAILGSAIYILFLKKSLGAQGFNLEDLEEETDDS